MKIAWLCALAALMSLQGAARADATYPSKPVTLVVPFAPGGGADIIGRQIAQKLAVRLKQPVIVDNRAGAGGAVGTTHAARASADGYTLALASASTLLTNPAVKPKLPYDPIKDFVPVAVLGSAPNLIVVNPQLLVRDVPELVALASRQSGGVSYASFGAGSTGHLCMEMIRATTKSALVHVPYNGTGPALNDLVAGHIQVGAVDLTASLPYLKAGKLRAIASCTRPTASLPGVKGYKEQGVPYDVLWSWVIVAPAGTPGPIVSRLHAEIKAVLADPEIVARWTEFGLEVTEMDTPHLSALIARQVRELTQLAREANISID